MTGSSVVLLETQDFEASLRSHVNENKPDPVLRRKIESMQLDWRNVPFVDDNALTKLNHSSSNSSNRIICGVLTLSSEFISFSIKAFCRWNIMQNVDESVTSKIEFELRVIGATCIISPLSNHVRKLKRCDDRDRSKHHEDEDSNEEVPPMKETVQSKKEKRIQRKIQMGMKQRFQSDYYIKKLLDINIVDSKGTAGKKNLKQGNNGHADDSVNEGLLLCRALIHQNCIKPNSTKLLKEEDVTSNITSNKNTLEEFFDMVEDTLKGLQRALFSFNNDETDAYLTTADFLLSMPYLPRNRHNQKEMNKMKSNNSTEDIQPLFENSFQENSQKTKDTSKDYNISAMADRVNLRLLEDAMFDACEMEGEDDLLDDLKISKSKQKLEA